MNRSFCKCSGERRGLDVTLLAELSSDSSSEDEKSSKASVQKKGIARKRKAGAMATNTGATVAVSNVTQDPATSGNVDDNQPLTAVKQRRVDGKSGKKKFKSELSAHGVKTVRQLYVVYSLKTFNRIFNRLFTILISMCCS